MRLLSLTDTGEFTWQEFVGHQIPPYAILSHTWGADRDEVTFKDLVVVYQQWPARCKLFLQEGRERTWKCYTIFHHYRNRSQCPYTRDGTGHQEGHQC